MVVTCVLFARYKIIIIIIIYIYICILHYILQFNNTRAGRIETIVRYFNGALRAFN